MHRQYNDLEVIINRLYLVGAEIIPDYVNKGKPVTGKYNYADKLINTFIGHIHDIRELRGMSDNDNIRAIWKIKHNHSLLKMEKCREKQYK